MTNPPSTPANEDELKTIFDQYIADLKLTSTDYANEEIPVELAAAEQKRSGDDSQIG